MAEVEFWERQKRYEKEAKREEYQEMLTEERRLEALEMLEEMKKARGDED